MEFPEWCIVKMVAIPLWASKKLFAMGFGRNFGIQDLDGISCVCILKFHFRRLRRCEQWIILMLNAKPRFRL